MAYVTTQIPVEKKSLLASISNAVGVFFASLTEANARAEKANRLFAMSDRQLSDIGLKREDIASRVFADMPAN